MPGKHGPNRLCNYIEVHERWMADFLEQGFVVDNQCAVTVHSDIVVVAGDIACLGSIVLQVK